MAAGLMAGALLLSQDGEPVAGVDGPRPNESSTGEPELIAGGSVELATAPASETEPLVETTAVAQETEPAAAALEPDDDPHGVETDVLGVKDLYSPPADQRQEGDNRKDDPQKDDLEGRDAGQRDVPPQDRDA